MGNSTFDPTRVRAILFDIDGTLADTDDQWVQRFSGWLKPLSFTFPQRDPRPFARRMVMSMDAPGNAVFALLDRLNLDGLLARLADSMRNKQKPVPGQGFTLIPGTLETFTTLHPHYPLGIVTARDKVTTQLFLEQTGLQSLVSVVASSQTCLHTKPYPDPINWAAEQLGVPPEQCLMVGDTVVDILAGRAAGVQTVGVLCGFGSADELAHAKADLILPHPSDLLAILLASS